MLNYKTRAVLFVGLFFLTHTIMGMNSGSPYTYDAYVPPVVRCTHKINRCFLNAALLIEDDKLVAARIEINKCYSFISDLEKTIKDFYQLPLRRLVNDLEILAKHSSDKKIKNTVIDQIIPRLSSFDPANDNIDSLLSFLATIKSMNSKNDVVHSLISYLSIMSLSMDTTHSVVFSVVSSLSAIRDQLNKLNSPLNTPDKFRTDLSNIMVQYDSIFSKFKSTSSDREPEASVASTIIDSLSTHQQKIQNLLSEKDHIKRQVNIKPQLLQPPITIAQVSLISKILGRVPLLERLLCWLLNNYNGLVKRFMGEQRYDGIKNNTYFNYIRKLHEKNLIRAVNIDKLLNNLTADKIIALIYKENQAFIDYCNNLQKYYCIELLECLHRAHEGSQKMLQKENQHFSFVFEDAMASNDNIKNEELQYNEPEKDNASWMLDTIISTTSQTLNYIASFDKKKFDNDIRKLANNTAEMAKLFVSSLSPWYQSPTNIYIPTNTQPRLIVAQPQMLGIKAFLSEINCDDNEKSKKSLLMSMIAAHTKLEQDRSRMYENYKKTVTTQAKRRVGKTLSDQWSSVSPQIDALYQSLMNLNEERKNLWFFNVLSAMENQRKRNEITNILQHHIDAYNMTKIKLYNEDNFYATLYSKPVQNESPKPIQESPYTKCRKSFLSAFPFSPQDNHDVFVLSQKDDRFKDYRYIFNPLEQTKMKLSIAK